MKLKKAYRIKQIWDYNKNLKGLFRYNAKQHWANWTRPVENWVCKLLVGYFHGKFEISGIQASFRIFSSKLRVYELLLGLFSLQV